MQNDSPSTDQLHDEMVVLRDDAASRHMTLLAIVYAKSVCKYAEQGLREYDIKHGITRDPDGLVRGE